MKNTKASVAPALWMYGAYARLDADETIEQLFYNGYCTISLGYAGLYECTKYMTGESHTQEKGKEFAMHVMDKLNEATVHCMDLRLKVPHINSQNAYRRDLVW